VREYIFVKLEKGSVAKFIINYFRTHQNVGNTTLLLT
jgi:hypothetical protein